MIGLFPFGQEVKCLKQTDVSEKKVFVLGVYASAVHAKWKSRQNKLISPALAVASEPYIFWRGEDADKTISQISIPEELGTLTPANDQYNGPSGVTLDEMIINPMGYNRSDCWLCDLVPHSCANPQQEAAIERAYSPLVEKYGLPRHSVPPVPHSLTDEPRREAIYMELVQSKATKLVLLGDKPIEWFLRFYDNRWRRLSDFLTSGKGYGKPVESRIGKLDIEVIPLAHPRQVARLGSSSVKWHDQHANWIREKRGL